MKEFTNADRANAALPHVKAFGAALCPDEELETQAADLVSDILHLLRRECHVADLQQWLLDRLDMHDQEVDEDPEE